MAEDSQDTRLAVKNAFELIAKDWDRLREKPWPVLLNFLEKFNCINYFSNDLLLDLGCGNGRHSIFFSEHVAYVIGVDFSFNLLRRARIKRQSQNIDNISYVLADINALPLKKNIFKSIIYLSTFHHIPKWHERIANLNEIKQVLQKDGYCMISVWRRWQKRFFWFFFKQIFKSSGSNEFGDINIPWKKQDGGLVMRFYHLFSQREFKKIIKLIDFQLILIKNFGGPTNNDNIFAIVRKNLE